MSRSYKHSPWCGDSNPKAKKKAARRFRRKVNSDEDVPGGNAYKKNSDSWNICDFGSYCPSVKDFIGSKRTPTKKEILDYKKWYFHK